MAKKRKLHRIADYCKRHGFEAYQFYKELNRHPDCAGKLQTDASGEYVTDEDTLKFIADKLQIRKEHRRKKYKSERSEKPSSAIAVEINSLAAENERLRKELERVSGENRRLRDVVECREIARTKYRKSDKIKKSEN